MSILVLIVKGSLLASTLDARINIARMEQQYEAAQVGTTIILDEELSPVIPSDLPDPSEFPTVLAPAKRNKPDDE